MGKFIGFLLVMTLLSGCTESASQRAINQFTTSTENEFHFVVFYEESPPGQQYQSQMNGMKVFLSRKNIHATITYQPMYDEQNYEEDLGVKDQQIIVFDYKGIRFNARNIHVLEGMVLQMTN